MADFCVAFSWPYSSDEEQRAQATDMFGKLKVDQGGFPLSVPHEVALVRSPSGYWFVAILTLLGGSGDDSLRIFKSLEAWLKKCNCPRHGDYESVAVRGSSIKSCLPEYEVADSFKSSRQESEMNSQSTAAADWYPDPCGRHELRYFDDEAWTQNVADGGQTAVDPDPIVGDSKLGRQTTKQPGTEHTLTLHAADKQAAENLANDPFFSWAFWRGTTATSSGNSSKLSRTMRRSRPVSPRAQREAVSTSR